MREREKLYGLSFLSNRIKIDLRTRIRREKMFTNLAAHAKFVPIRFQSSTVDVASAGNMFIFAKSCVRRAKDDRLNSSLPLP